MYFINFFLIIYLFSFHIDAKEVAQIKYTNVESMTSVTVTIDKEEKHFLMHKYDLNNLNDWSGWQAMKDNMGEELGEVKTSEYSNKVMIGWWCGNGGDMKVT